MSLEFDQVAFKSAIIAHNWKRRTMLAPDDPTTASAAEREIKHLRKASTMLHAQVATQEKRIQSLLREINLLTEPGQESALRKLEIENERLRAENERLQQTARTAAAAWLTYARRFQAANFVL